MFKAISRWGSQVRSSLSGGFLSNLFGSKSRKYGEFNEETEEIFSDALEELESDDDVDGRLAVAVEPKSPKTKTEATEDILKVSVHEPELASGDTQHSDTGGDISDAKDIAKETKDENIQSTPQTVDTHLVETCSVSSSHSSDSSQDLDKDKTDDNNEHNTENDADNEQHDEHDDTKQIVESPSKENGIPHSSSSASMFQKMHRRINSYTQRQYAKFDNTQEDENDNRIANCDADVDTYSVDHDDVDKIVISEKKTKKKKKVPLFSFLRGIFRRTK